MADAEGAAGDPDPTASTASGEDVAAGGVGGATDGMDSGLNAARATNSGIARTE